MMAWTFFTSLWGLSSLPFCVVCWQVYSRLRDNRAIATATFIFWRHSQLYTSAIATEYFCRHFCAEFTSKTDRVLPFIMAFQCKMFTWLLSWRLIVCLSYSIVRNFTWFWTSHLGCCETSLIFVEPSVCTSDWLTPTHYSWGDTWTMMFGWGDRRWSTHPRTSFSLVLFYWCSHSFATAAPAQNQCSS